MIFALEELVIVEEIGMSDKTPNALRDITSLASGRIFEIRGQRVILDADIAELFGRTTKTINQQRSRNKDHFPDHYAFQLTTEEWADLKSQNVTSSEHGGRRHPPWAFTEHGFAMLCTRLRGEQAAQISRIIIDTFVSYRKGTLPRERIISGDKNGKRKQRLQDAIYQQMEALLQLELPTGENTTTELKELTAKAIHRVKAVLDAPVLKNEQITAEIGKLQAETAKLYADAQKLSAETANIWADTFQKRLQIITQLREMAVQLERDDVLAGLDEAFGDNERKKLE